MIIIWLLLLLSSSLISYGVQIKECFGDDDLDCDDNIWCNGLETCINDTCVNGVNPCDILIQNVININKEFGFNHFQVVCYETDHTCLWRYKCFSDKDCNDNFSCNGEEICNKSTNLCIKSNKNLCKDNESCDFKQNKCITNQHSSSSSNNTISIVITILISIFIIILIAMLLLMVLSVYIFKSNENK